MIEALDTYYAAIESHLMTLTPDERERDAGELLDDEAWRWMESEADWHELKEYEATLAERFPLTAQLRDTRKRHTIPGAAAGKALAQLARAMHPALANSGSEA